MNQSLIYLDRVGDAPVPEGYKLVETEVDFLRLAPEGNRLMVRGDRLCNWANDYFKGRRITVRETQSPAREIQTAVPFIAEVDAKDLYERIGSDMFANLERPLRPLHILEALFPMRMWRDEPSLAHAAEWLVWLYKQQPDLLIRNVFSSILDRWRANANEPERLIYQANDGKEAGECLRAWLYIAPRPEFTDMGVFPHAVPRDLMEEAGRVWNERIIHSKGDAFEEIMRQPIPGPLRRAAAEETAAYLSKNPDRLTRARFRELQRFLSLERQEELTRLLPPEPPTELPAQIKDILAWFELEYLPYRLWQSRYGDQEAAGIARLAARRFAEWYLAEYPKGLVGGVLHEHLIFNQTIIPDREAGMVTIVIVLDGLHAEDARRLVMALERDVTRLTLLEERYVLAVIPTVTQFAKDALLKGRDPGEAKDKPSLAPVLPERIDPTHQLAKARPGDVLVWRVMEPDSTYHGRNTYDTLARAIESALNRVSLTIGDITRNVPNEASLRVIITTDHGRYLDKASRTVVIPPGMQSHGRAAWGKRLHDFDDTGVLFEDEIAYLHGERFGLPEDVAEAAVFVDAGMFLTNDGKAGSEAYPHGGASPEEVIVPWLVFHRDWQVPDVSITLIGSGVAGRKGEARLQVTNLSDLPLTISRITLHFADSTSHVHELKVTINPRDNNGISVTLDPWPTEAEYEKATAQAAICLPAGQQFNIPIKLDLTVEELYRRDNILEDLE